VVAGRPPSADAGRGARGLIRRALAIDAYDGVVGAASATLVAAGQMRFAGILDDVVPLLASADALVFPAAVPHFGRPLIEAAAMGLSAIASSLGSASELVVDNVTGQLVPPSNPSALAQALLALLNDPQRAATMGEAAYLRARGLFDADVNARATFDVYREVLA
jgi:glycosyltransferase involved in cell wall biosynthesis